MTDTTGSAGTSDPDRSGGEGMTHHDALVDGLAEVAMTRPGEDCRNLKRHEITEISAFDVVAAAQCQASAAAPPSPFQPDMFTATKTVALRAVPGLRRHKSALASVGAIMREAQRVDDGAADDDWLRAFLKESPIDVRARVAARASGWLSRILELLEVDDVAETRRWRTKMPLRWDYPGRGLRLRATIDLGLPDPHRPGALVPVVVGSGASPWLDAELAYLHLLWKSSQRAVAIPEGDNDRPTPGRRSTTRAVLELDVVLVVDFQESTVTRRPIADRWELGLSAVQAAAVAVTERDRVLDLAGGSGHDLTLLPESMLASCFPSQLDQHAHVWRCQRCSWLAVCPSPSVNIKQMMRDRAGDNAGHYSPADQPDDGDLPTEPASTLTQHGGSSGRNLQPVVAGGIRLLDHHVP